MRTCAECPTRLPITARADARYCSTRCRVRAHRRRPPAELLERPRWIRRSVAKVPLTVSGERASATDPGTWSTWTEAKASTAGAGLGFVLDGDGVACIDLDYCLAGDRVAPWAQAVLDRCPATYVEVSPSGDGLHVWGLAHVGAGRKVRLDGGTAEVYDRGRYMTITNRRHAGAPAVLADLTEVVAALTNRPAR